jgi:hypothetical protein
VFLALLHSAEVSVGSPGTDADVKALFESLQVKQEDKRAVLLATVPTEVLRKIAESPDQLPNLAPETPSTKQDQPVKSKSR